MVLYYENDGNISQLTTCWEQTFTTQKDLLHKTHKVYVAVC